MPNLANPADIIIFTVSFQDFYDQIIELARSDMGNIRKPFQTATNQCDLDAGAPENND